MPLKQSKIKVEGNNLSLIRADNRYINTGGDTMDGNLSMNTNKITDLTLCNSDNDAASKLYVDSTIKASLSEQSSITSRLKKLEQNTEGSLAINADRIHNLEDRLKKIDELIQTKTLTISLTNIVQYKKYPLLTYPLDNGGIIKTILNKKIFVIKLMVQDFRFADHAPATYIDCTSNSVDWYLSDTSSTLNLSYLGAPLIRKDANIMLYYFEKF